MRTPTIALLTTLAAFAAYRQQADGSTLPTEDLEPTDAKATEPKLELESVPVAPQGTVALPETQSPQTLSSPLRSRFNQTVATSSRQFGLGATNRPGLSQLTAEINDSIEQTRQNRFNQRHVQNLLDNYDRTLLAGQTQPLAGTTTAAPSVSLASLPPLPQSLPPTPTLQSSSPGVNSEGLSQPASRSAASLQAVQPSSYPVHQPETQSKQPKFSSGAIAAMTPLPVNATPSRQSTRPMASAKPQPSPAIAAQVTPEAEPTTASETTPALAGQYHFSDRVQVQPADVLTASAPGGTPDQANICAAQPTSAEAAPELDLLLAAETETLAEHHANAAMPSVNPFQPEARAFDDEANLSNSVAVCEDDTNVLAQSMPEAATAGTPMPGIVLSPTR